MTKAKEISDYERAYFELEKIRQQVDSLSDFLLSKIREEHSSTSRRRKTLIDPRTGEPFGVAKKRVSLPLGAKLHHS